MNQNGRPQVNDIYTDGGEVVLCITQQYSDLYLVFPNMEQWEEFKKELEGEIHDLNAVPAVVET